jgi:hypothetical protein
MVLQKLPEKIGSDLPACRGAPSSCAVSTPGDADASIPGVASDHGPSHPIDVKRGDGGIARHEIVGGFAISAEARVEAAGRVPSKPNDAVDVRQETAAALWKAARPRGCHSILAGELTAGLFGGGTAGWGAHALASAATSRQLAPIVLKPFSFMQEA